MSSRFMNGRARPSSLAAHLAKAYIPSSFSSFSFPPYPPSFTSTFCHNTIMINSFNSFSQIQLKFTCG